MSLALVGGGAKVKIARATLSPRRLTALAEVTKASVCISKAGNFTVTHQCTLSPEQDSGMGNNPRKPLFVSQ